MLVNKLFYELNELCDYHSEVHFIHLKVYETELTVSSIQAVNMNVGSLVASSSCDAGLLVVSL